MNKRSSVSTKVAALIVIIVAGIGIYYYENYLQSLKISGTIVVAAEAGYNDAAIKKIAQDYMATHPGTTIKVVTLSFDTALSSYVTAFSSGSDVYDVVFLPNVGYLGNIAPYLVNLKPYLSNTKYFSSFLQHFGHCAFHACAF
ncbi:MAG: extracellular solute-binding protein [Nitrososphaeria archaeon]